MDYRGALHQDGSVLMSVSLDQLKVTFGLQFPCFLFWMSRRFCASHSLSFIFYWLELSREMRHPGVVLKTFLFN